MLKLRLAQALTEYRNKVPLWRTICPNDPDYEAKIEANLILVKARANNEVLKHYCHLGSLLSVNHCDYRTESQAHIIGTFLHGYFGEEYDAIPYLSDVTKYQIARLSEFDRTVIILTKPRHMATPTPEPDDHYDPPFFSPSPRTSSPVVSLSGLHPGTSELWQTRPSSTLERRPTNLNLSEDEADDRNDHHADFEENPCRRSSPISFSISTTSLLEPPQYDPAASATLRRRQSRDTDRSQSAQRRRLQ
jgi:hypothetical protein